MDREKRVDLQKCKNGHYYDASIYTEDECPMCNLPSFDFSGDRGGDAVMNGMEYDFSGGMGVTTPLGGGGMAGGMGVTMPLGGGMAGSNVGVTMPLGGSMAGGNMGMGNMGGMSTGATMPLSQGMTAPINATIPPMDHTPAMEDESHTVGFIQKQLGYDPVVGWLVCIDGDERGKDYRIHGDNNFIGRAENMDICIRGDESISKNRHAIISYDSRSNSYYLASGEGRSMIRVNDKPVLGVVELNAMDTIEIGMTKLKFVPLCGEKFVWE